MNYFACAPSSCCLWFNIPVCTFVSRNDTYCVTGRINLKVYEATSVDIQKLSYPWSATVGERIPFTCPSLDSFNKTGRMIEWYKVRGSTVSALAAPEHKNLWVRTRCHYLSRLCFAPLSTCDTTCSFLTGLQPHCAPARQNFPQGRRNPDHP